MPLHPPAPASTREDDTEILAAPQLLSHPSPVEDEREPSPSLQLPGGSPDPLDLITSEEDDVDSRPSQLHECPRSPQTPISLSPSLGSSDPAASSEPKHSDVGGPTEIGEAEAAPDPLDHLELSESSECGAEPDEPAGSPTSHPLEDNMSRTYGSPIPAKDEVSSQRSQSEPCKIFQSVESPSHLEDGTEALAASTPGIATHVSEPQGESGVLHWATGGILFHSTEPFEAFEAKEEISLDDNQPIGTQLRQEDAMDVEVEQGDGPQAASPVTDQSRRDRKLRASRLHTLLIIPDKRKVSEAASIFSDSIRDRKKVREDSQPVDDDEPGVHSPFLIPWSISICRRSRARAPPRTTSCG